ncbi:tRNA lysidine(34) synthetase TilS [Thalassolituus sp.]|uniref:tRNA lysidine(34) synthetase TilS n=2 Tax=Thalassolituus sp. TaxID=2030822 RepID=UPI003515CA00
MNSSSVDQCLARLDRDIEQSLADYPDRKLYVGLSGGLDSVLLLSRLAALETCRTRLTAVHVNHNLHPDAAHWQAFVGQLCADLNVELIVEAVAVVEDGRGVESAARDARYQVFEQKVESGGLLLLAHHGSDQGETLLLRLFRGSGLRGLRGMPVSRPLTRHPDETRLIIRPWLSITRAHLAVAAHSLKWIEDDSNNDQTFDRNWLRHSLIPLLQARYPAIEQTLIQTSQNLSEDYELLQSLLQPELNKALIPTSWPATGRFALSLDALATQPKRMQFHMLRHWFDVNQHPMPQGQRIWHWLDQCLTAGADRQPNMAFDGAVLQRHQGALYIWYEQTTPGSVHCVPDRWGRGRLAADQRALPNGYQLISAKLAAGRRVQRKPNHSLSLKNIWQANNVPPWLREHWPLLVFDEEIVAVIGLVNECSLLCDEVDNLSLEWLSDAT